MRLTIGSRGSKLALWQAEWAKQSLLKVHPGADVSIEVIRTEGDRNQAPGFVSIGGKGLFTKEVDEALLDGRTDFSVHSLKDLPTILPDGLGIAAVSPRADARDALCAAESSSLDALPEGARVATSSLRRQALLKVARPDLHLLPLRGNVDTRVRKLREESLDAIVLAAAGLDRLGLQETISERLNPIEFVPAPGQAAMGVVTRLDDVSTLKTVACLDHADARTAGTAERGALHRLGGGCRIPFGAWARIESGALVADGVVSHPDGTAPIRAKVTGNPAGPIEVGEGLAESLLSQGAQAILDAVLT